MPIQHNPYLYGIRIEGIFYPLSDRASEYKHCQDFGDYIDYYIHFRYIPKEYMENIYNIRYFEGEIFLESYDEITDTYLINASGLFTGEFSYGMNVWGTMEFEFSMRKYKVGGKICLPYLGLVV